ncbi:hypothetical protein [Thermococcus sp. P6]|uniref:hypothetical protein n=1 Tax=Thermococcus sp. P6 TaxID=122420 RepID=UPI0012FD9F55|nr:hypothetical protein [Thermococcus sp. P6]
MGGPKIASSLLLLSGLFFLYYACSIPSGVYLAFALLNAGLAYGVWAGTGRP